MSENGSSVNRDPTNVGYRRLVVEHFQSGDWLLAVGRPILSDAHCRSGFFAASVARAALRMFVTP